MSEISLILFSRVTASAVACLGMESQMVQNSRNKINLTFKEFVMKVKGDFNQPQQNQFTFNRYSLKVMTFRIKLNKIMSPLSRNYLSRARDI